jgi:hypothetical protein
MLYQPQSLTNMKAEYKHYPTNELVGSSRFSAVSTQLNVYGKGTFP